MFRASMGLVFVLLTPGVAAAQNTATEILNWAPSDARNPDWQRTLRNALSETMKAPPPGSVVVFYPIPEGPMQPFATPPALEGAYRRKFGMNYITPDRMVELSGKGMATRSALEVIAPASVKARMYPRLVEEVFYAIRNNPGISEADLRQRVAAMRAETRRLADGQAPPTAGERLAKIGVSAVLEGLPAGRGVSRTAPIFADELREAAGSFFAVGEGEAFSRYLQAVRQKDSDYNALTLSFALAQDNPRARAVLNELAEDAGMPGLYAAENVTVYLKGQFPLLRIEETEAQLRALQAAWDASAGGPGASDDVGRRFEAVAMALLDDAQERQKALIAENARAMDLAEWDRRFAAASAGVSLAHGLANLNNPRAAARVARIGGAGLGIAQAYRDNVLALPTDASETLKSWSSVAMYTSVAAIGVSLLASSQPDPNTELLKEVLAQLDVIKGMIADLHKMSAVNFALLNDKMSDLNNDMQRGFDDVLRAIDRSEKTQAAIYVDVAGLRRAIETVRSDMYYIAELELQGKYGAAECALTFRQRFERVDDRVGLLDRCLSTLLQQLYEPERNTLLAPRLPMEGASAEAVLERVLDAKDVAGWYDPAIAYPAVQARQPYYYTSLANLTGRFQTPPAAPMVANNVAYWRFNSAQAASLIRANGDVARRSSVAPILLQDALGMGRNLMDAGERVRASGGASPLLAAALESYRKESLALRTSLTALEDSYFSNAMAPGVKYLGRRPQRADPAGIERNEARMAPCETPLNSANAPKDARRVPPVILAAVPEAYRVAEALGKGRLGACYRASYVADGFGTQYAYDTPNTRIYDIRSRYRIEIDLNWTSADPRRSMAETVLKVRGVSKAVVGRETIQLSKSCRIVSWNKDIIIAGDRNVVAEMFQPPAFSNRDVRHCFLSGSNARALDEHLDRDLAVEDGILFTSGGAAAVSLRPIARELAAERARTQRSFVEFLSFVSSAIVPSGRSLAPSDIDALLRAKLMDSDDFARNAGYLMLSDGGVIDRISRLERRRSFIVFYLNTFFPEWIVEPDLYKGFLSNDPCSRLMDGQYFALVAAQRAGSCGRFRNVDDLWRGHDARVTSVRMGLSAVTARRAEVPASSRPAHADLARHVADLEALSSSLAVGAGAPEEPASRGARPRR